MSKLFICACGFVTDADEAAAAHKREFMGPPDFECPRIVCNTCKHAAGSHSIHGDCAQCGKGDPCGF